MAWKLRNGRAYLYKSIRLGGQVRTLYFGTGLAARTVALVEEQAREERGRLREERRRMEREERETATWFENVEVLADAAMLAAGFHRHHREWRRRHGHPANAGQVGAEAPDGDRENRRAGPARRGGG
jgi:hypothetical protein